MPGYELLADFNRSGRLERNATERAAANLDPGAIVAANLDRDGRALPTRVTAGSEVAGDHTLASKHARDNDPAPLLLAAERGADQHHLTVGLTSLFLSGIRLLDSHKNRARPVIGTGGRYDFGAQRGDVDLFVEVATLAGSPLRGFPSLNPSRWDAHRSPAPLDERRFSITMNARPLAGGAESSGHGVFTIAPWIMVDESAPLLRLYIAEADNASNHPSLEDLRRALVDPSRLHVVPLAIANGDTWLQDQFELGCFHTPTGVTLALLHMPRLRRNYTGRGATSSLPNFVRSHFPSSRVGVFDEFWRRTVPVEDVAGQRVDIGFEASAKVREALLRPFLLRSHLLWLAGSGVLSANPLVGPDGKPLAPPPFVTLSQAVQDNAAWRPLVTRRLEADVTAAGAGTTARQLLELYRTDLAQRVRLTDAAVTVGAGGIQVTAQDPPAPGAAAGTTVWTAVISADTANRLEDRLSQMHASQNYGGNFQVAPPTAAAPYGRIVIGNDQYGREGLVDTEILNFLDKQKVQPLLQVDTSWLGVAHVDEVLSFVPKRRGAGRHALWLNSPGLALALLQAALDHYLAGLPSLNDWVPHLSSIGSRDLTRGTSPVTSLLRGKFWTHVHRPGSTDLQEPAQFYITLADRYNKSAINIHNTPWQPGPGTDRSYPARMTVREVIALERAYTYPDPNFIAEEGSSEPPPQLSTNQIIEEDKIAYLREQMRDAYPDLEVVRVPTLYDLVVRAGAQTGAFTPNAANIVIDGTRLIVPKPFGPRVRPVDAVAIVTQAFTAYEMQAMLAGFNERWLRDSRNRLLGVKQWFRHEDLRPLSGLTDLHKLAAEFADGFVGVPAERLRERILRENRSHFRDENLRDGWRELTIPEDTVDLFEVAIALAARSLGLEWRFVDSWSYHVTFGEIHCGTNALRTPSFSGTPWWDFFFRAPSPAGAGNSAVAP